MKTAIFFERTVVQDQQLLDRSAPDQIYQFWRTSFRDEKIRKEVKLQDFRSNSPYMPAKDLVADGIFDGEKTTRLLTLSLKGPVK